ncbi:hypothetical protein B0T25DRAFT_524449 [Lasiosphaeria hispida]|uniref:Uncharacterized protein n=1 Tax=Lasiosphaeria hispida TaxID=260671 RepID=A0AAJ0HTA5_9PEZI|nr:hypothetical protein B0T25DRAFT_524449 [Lasiosphaeria hispida]
MELTETVVCGRRISFATNMVSLRAPRVSHVLFASLCLPAAMPSLYSGYSFLIGLTTASVPLRKRGWMGWRRVAIVYAGMIYPAVILAAIVSTANNSILDAVAGAIACGLAWKLNDGLLNLLPLEDYFLSVVSVHKP